MQTSAHESGDGWSPAGKQPVDLDPLEAGILRMVLYFDVFRHPLSLGELTRFLAPGQPQAVRAAADALAHRGQLGARGRYRFVPGAEARIAHREIRARCAEQAWPKARLAASVLARIPFVRGLMVTGSLSKNSTEPDGDVDFLVLVEPGRVWTLKSMLQGMRRCLPGQARELFCTNYLLATDQLRIDERNLFTAIELATAVPMHGRQACVDFLQANRWAEAFVPGLDWAIDRARNAPDTAPHRGTRAVERAWASGAAGWAEDRAMGFWDRYWNHKYDWVDAQVRAQRFKRREEIATNHLHDFQNYVLREVRQRFRAAGLNEALVYGHAIGEA